MAMLHRAASGTPIHVLVATPAGATGQGGIDRVMASLKQQIEQSNDKRIAVRFGATRGGGHVLLSPLYLGWFVLGLLQQRALRRLDLVHVNLSISGSTYRKLLVARLCRWLGVPYVLHLHGGNYPKFWGLVGPRLSREIERMFEGAARILVLGETWRRFVSDRVPEATARIAVIPNAAAMPRLEHVGGGSSVHILFLGRISDLKGVPQLGEALYRMRDLPGWRATIAGDGAVEQARAKIAEMGLTDRIALPGWVDGAEVAALVAAADILVLPSFVENLPVSVIEGMASGLAVVTTPVGAIEDIITDNETGLLVPVGDVDALTAALTRAVLDPDLRARLGAAARTVHRERLELGAYAKRMVSIWLEAATGAEEPSDGVVPRNLPGSGAMIDER